MATAQTETKEITGSRPDRWRGLVDTFYLGTNPLPLALVYLVVLTLAEVMAVLCFPQLGVIFYLALLILKFRYMLLDLSQARYALLLRRAIRLLAPAFHADGVTPLGGC